MLNNNTIVAIIPARGSSKQVPRKNLAIVSGLPLIVWTIKAALECEYIDSVYVSTEDEEIAQIAANSGSMVLQRPNSYAQDHVQAKDVVINALQQINEHDIAVMLQPTTPLRTSKHIREGLETMFSMGALSCISVTRPKHHPHLMQTINDAGWMEPLFSTSHLKQRQELPDVYSLNGAFYASYTDELRKNQTFVTEKTAAYVMENSVSLDIDTLHDLQIANYLLSNSLD